MLTVTVEEFRSWGPCWDAAKLDAFFASYIDEEPWTALDVLALRRVSVEDRLWVVLREELISEPTLRLFACDCAQKAMDDHGNGDKRSLEAIRVARLHAGDEATDSERAAARDAARDAGEAAGPAGGAAWAAASAARAAAGGPASAARAAGGAAWAAARAAAGDAGAAAESQWQIKRLRTLIRKGE